MNLLVGKLYKVTSKERILYVMADDMKEAVDMAESLVNPEDKVLALLKPEDKVLVIEELPNIHYKKTKTITVEV